MKVKRLQISPELFLGLFKAGEHPARGYRLERDAVPDDAKFVNVQHAWPNGIEILIESETFPELVEGDEIPFLTPIITTYAVNNPDEGMDAV